MGPLQGLTEDKFMMRWEPDLYGYLHRLDGLNFIQPHPGRRLVDIREQHEADERCPYEQRPPFNLKDFVYITGEGKKYLSTLKNILEKTEERIRGST